MKQAVINWRLMGKAVVAGVVVFIASTLVEFDPLEIDEWATWAIDIGGGLARSVGAAVIAVVWVSSTSNDSPAEDPE